MKIDLDQIRDLLSVVSSTDVTELTIEFGDQRITVKKAAAKTEVIQTVSPKPIVVKSEDSSAGITHSQEINVAPPQAAPAPAPAAAPTPQAATASASEPETSSGNGFIEITSPMVGTFYRAPSPEAPPFVAVGDHINEGQTVCIIEAMKLMNDMPSEVSGKIVKIIAENGSTVEYGQALFLVDPKG